MTKIRNVNKGIKEEMIKLDSKVLYVSEGEIPKLYININEKHNHILLKIKEIHDNILNYATLERLETELASITDKINLTVKKATEKGLISKEDFN